MDNDNLGIGAHSDFECFIVLHQQAPGPQVMNAADEWVAAPPILGAFIVNIGDLLEGWTNGRSTATQHRVVNTERVPGRGRAREIVLDVGSAAARSAVRRRGPDDVWFAETC